MKFFFNILFGWIAILSGILLSVIWFIRIVQRKIPKGNPKNYVIKINKYLRKHHIYLGYLFIIASLIHGRLSSFSVISLNYGTLAFIIGLGITYTYVEKAKLGKKWIKYHRVLTLLIIMLTGVHIMEVDGFVGVERVWDQIKQDFQGVRQVDEASDTLYVDGVYEGVGDGYRPGLKVEITVQDGLIQDILIKEHNEVGRKFYLPAFDLIPTQIIEKQSTQVDRVSGATYSSRGIMEAVEDALSQAIKP